MNKIFIASIILLVNFQFSFSQQFNKLKLDSFLYALDSNDKFMGSIAVSLNNEVIYSNSIGYDDIESKKKSTNDSKYRIGSITKMFTASLIFKAAEENKINLDSTIKNFFPSVDNSDKIKISDLLYHRSGIFNFTNDPSYSTWSYQYKSEDELLSLISEKKSVFEPGSKAEYSNANFILLTFILEKIYNKPYKDLVLERIIIPLNLNNTYVGSKINITNNECFSYSYSESWKKEKETDMSIPLGAGSIVSNPSDLTRFITDLFNEKIISEESLSKMITIKDGYGMAIFQVPYFEKKGYGHGGGIDAFSSFLVYFPEDKLSVAITSNGSNYNNNSILIAALGCYYNRPFEIPVFNKITLNSEDLDKYLGTYSSKQIPLKITISKENNLLRGQATGQPSFPLDPVSNDVFRFDRAGIEIVFKPDENTMILKQGGGVFTYIKE